MKNKIRVLMLDDNENIVNAVKEHFSSHAVIDIVLTCHDGKKGYDMILEKENEIILFHLLYNYLIYISLFLHNYYLTYHLRYFFQDPQLYL